MPGPRTWPDDDDLDDDEEDEFLFEDAQEVYEDWFFDDE